MSELCVRKTKSFRGSNTGATAAYFSIKRRKWIRPRVKWGTETIFTYHIYPGKYIKVEVSYWNKRDPPFRVTASLVRLACNEDEDKDSKEAGWVSGFASALVQYTRALSGETCDEKVIASAHYEVSNADDLPNEILKDAVIAMPRYHSSPSYDFTKQYPEDVVKDLINRIKRNEEYIARIEYE